MLFQRSDGLGSQRSTRGNHNHYKHRAGLRVSSASSSRSLNARNFKLGTRKDIYREWAISNPSANVKIIHDPRNLRPPMTLIKDCVGLWTLRRTSPNWLPKEQAAFVGVASIEHIVSKSLGGQGEFEVRRRRLLVELKVAYLNTYNN